MPGRNLVLATGEYYHIFNRGVARQPTFFTKRDYERFLLSLSYYRFSEPPVRYSRLMTMPVDVRDEILADLEKSNKTLVQVVCYTLMPNHFHLILKQTKDKGITTFMSKLLNSYTKYVNTKQERVGDLYQGVFKSVHIETNEQLLHLTRYIHLNPITGNLVKFTELIKYPWSSLLDYLGERKSFVESAAVLSQFKHSQDYKKFILDQIDYQKHLEIMNHLIIEK